MLQYKNIMFLFFPPDLVQQQPIHGYTICGNHQWMGKSILEVQPPSWSTFRYHNTMPHLFAHACHDMAQFFCVSSHHHKYTEQPLNGSLVYAYR